MMCIVQKTLEPETRQKRLDIKNSVKGKCGQDLNAKNFPEKHCSDNSAQSAAGWRDKQFLHYVMRHNHL